MNETALALLVLTFAALGAIGFILWAADLLVRLFTGTMRPPATEETDRPAIRLFDPGDLLRRRAPQALVESPVNDPWGWLATGFVLAWDDAHEQVDYHRMKLLLERADAALFSAWIEIEHDFLKRDDT